MKTYFIFLVQCIWCYHRLSSRADSAIDQSVAPKYRINQSSRQSVTCFYWFKWRLKSSNPFMHPSSYG